ncbi:MAG: siroheme synthase CysG [Alphaproteobacteria bacterium]
MHAVSRLPSDRAPARMAKLAVLPVFMDMRGARAIVAGGTDAAAWKAELLAAAGAEVHVYARSSVLGDAFRSLLASVSAEASVIHHDADWNEDCLAGSVLAVADAADAAEASAFAAAAKRSGVPCNVIDRPQAGGIQFGSIVNRSPVVVGISTGATAPVLGQAIRRRIETLLPPSLADWAAMAGRLRALVRARIEPGARRRRFWEAFAERAFAAGPVSGDDGRLLREVSQVSAGLTCTGHVALVGAGPGNAELLTLKAVRMLQAADVILFDELVSDEVLDLARREARRMLVGKRGGRPSCRQEDINDLMVRLAKTGKRVVRLKSGDPMIFGRAGEEIARLEREGIPVEVVPGITAALAMASTLGVSLTHRDVAQSVRFVTGHSKQGGLPPDIDWKAVADPAATTIFYMGGRTAGRIATRLTAEGMPPSVPAVMAAAVTRREQRLWAGTLGTLTAGIEAIGDGLPVVIGVGRVFAQACESQPALRGEAEISAHGA